MVPGRGLRGTPGRRLRSGDVSVCVRTRGRGGNTRFTRSWRPLGVRLRARGWAFLTLAPSHSTHTLFPLQYHYPGAPLLSLRFTYDRNDSLLVAAGLPALPLAESSRALLGAAEAVMAKSEGGEPGRVGSVVGSVV